MQYEIRICIALLCIVKYEIGRAVISLTDSAVKDELRHIWFVRGTI